MYKILIVEDEMIIRKGLIYSTDFSLVDGMVIAEANNGKEGIELIKKYNPDIVITDINMPIVNGLEMIEKTYQEYTYSAIILSGYNDFEYAKTAMSFGVNEYLLKPVNHDELIEAIKNSIKQLEMRKLYIKASKNTEEIVSNNLILENNKISFCTKEIISIIEEKYMEKLKMEYIVNKLRVSATLLNNKFKEDTGLTFNDYLNRYRIKIAIKLLKENKYPIYKISELSGFSDYKYFVKVFNKYAGVSPSKYQNMV